MTIMPSILKETAEGFIRCSVHDELFKAREIECTGEISEESVCAMIAQIRYLAREDAEKEITLYINSPGGEIGSGLALYDVMQAVPCPIRTVCVGQAASMAAVLFAGGDKREMLPNARVMIHDPRIMGGAGGTALQIEAISQQLMKKREIIAEILAKHTGKSADQILAKTCTDSYFNAQEAIAFGLADSVIDKL